LLETSSNYALFNRVDKNEESRFLTNFICQLKALVALDMYIEVNMSDVQVTIFTES
jgi:hypothetical protein